MKYIDLIFSSDGLRTTFVLLFIAMMLCLYETIMFYYIVTPPVKNRIDLQLGELGSHIGDKIENKKTSFWKTMQENQPLINKHFNNEYINKINSKLTETNIDYNAKQKLLHIFNTLDDRELLLVTKINNYTKVTAIVLIIVLILVLYGIKYTLNSRGEEIGLCHWLYAFITLGLILIFQYMFYILGKKYSYLGFEGNEELIVHVLSEL